MAGFFATRFSLSRLIAVMVKEFIQMRRDRLTFGMMVGIPVIQLTLFGFAINSDPRQLPTAILVQDNSVFARSLVRALENSNYFRVVRQISGPEEGEALLASYQVLFVVTIPAGFARDLQRGERPAVLVEADATDPVATANALGALANLNRTALDHDLTGSLAALRAEPPAFEIRMHRRYNPEGLSQYNIVPGLMGVILTMTMVMMTALAMTRERERGTMENLLAMPVRPVEVMLGKIVPYIMIGYVQVTLVMIAAIVLFHVPMAGNLLLLLLCVAVFIAANLAIGFTFSTVAKNQLQAMQMAFFFFLPQILLSGFMFPFRGMPGWAQTIGEVLPLTHFLRLVRGIMLKGNEFPALVPDLWPLAAFLLAAAAVALNRYRQTLD